MATSKATNSGGPGQASRKDSGRPKKLVSMRDAPKLRWADNTPIDSEDARGRILAAAVDCVLRLGVDKTGMDDVARAAAITRPTVYKHFASRNELIIAVFLRVLDDRLDRGLETFFASAGTVEGLRDGVADATMFVLQTLRDDETIQSILYSDRIPPGVLLAETAGMLVGVLEVSLTRAVGSVMTPDLLPKLRPAPLDEIAGWIIRVLFAFLAWPGESIEAERQMFRDYLSPIFVLDVG